VTWNGIRDTLLWMVVLLLLAVIAIGGISARWWAARDDLLTDLVRTHLSQSLPDCNVTFESVRCLELSRFEISQLVVQARKTGEDLLRAPRVVIQIDSRILTQHQRVVIRELVAHSPEVHCIRDQNNRWNWEGIAVNTPPSSVSPEWTIKNGAIRVGFASPVNGQTRFINIQGIQATLRPESHQRYDFDGLGAAEVFGNLQLSGLLDVGTGEWHVRGAAGDVRLGDSLLDLAARFSPDVQEQLTMLRSTNQALLSQALTHQPARAVSAGELTPLPLVTASSHSRERPIEPASLLRADLAIQFELGQSRPESKLDYLLTGQVSHGQVSELLLPVPLYDLDGKFRLSPDLLEIRDLRAANGASTLFINGSASRVAGKWGKNFLVRATQLSLDDRIRSFLWGKAAYFFDLLSPSGTFDLSVAVTQKPGAPLEWRLEDFKAINCRSICDFFRYPVDRIHGEIQQQGDLFLLNLQGEAAGRPVKLSGQVAPQRTNHDVDLKIEVTGMPVDQALQNALQRPEQKPIRTALESLRLNGTSGDVHVRVVRNPETNGRVFVCIDGELVDGTMNYSGFPYELTSLRGKLRFNPFERNTWIFQDLYSKHGIAEITGRAIYDLEESTGQLAIEMSALQLPLDFDLERATTAASPEMKTAWNDFGIKGNVDIDNVSLAWSPGEKCQVTLDGIHWTNGQLTPKSLPYTWQNVAGTLRWDGSRLRIHSLQGDHGGAYMLVSGAAPDSAYVHIAPSPDVAWRLFLDEKTLHIRKLSPDDELKRAVPGHIAATLNAIQLKNVIDVTVGLDVKGWTAFPDLMTASWSTFVTLNNNELIAGIPLTAVNGNIVHRGSWDGRNLEMEGFGELESLRALEMPFRKIQGPFLLKDNRLTIGAPKLSGNEPVHSPGNPYRKQSVRARLYGGQIGIDVELLLSGNSESLPYRVELAVNDVELGEWAREHNYQKLLGKVNGVLQASGRGTDTRSTTGQGWVQITPAALYELPVFAQMMTILSFRPAQPGDAAFDYAYADFTIHDEVFDFGNIELVGDALNFGGRGTVGYAGSKTGALSLDFNSRANRRLPLIGQLAGGWVWVQVLGSLQSGPIAKIQPTIPYLDDAFANFRQAVDSGQRQPRTPPRLGRPPTAGQPPAVN